MGLTLDDFHLLDARDEHFAWMLDKAPAPDGLTNSDGNLDSPQVLRWLRRTLRHTGHVWIMVAGADVAGTCLYKGPVGDAGEVEIGYGVKPSHRRKGYATRAVALILEKAAADPRIRAVTAETALANLPSQRVLVANGFADVGRGHDDEEGETIVWRREV